jgi:tetratricopeptide (TPR) repeat protein
MKKVLSALSVITAIIFSAAADANMILDKSSSRVKIYQTQKLMDGWDAVVKGKITSISSMDTMDEKDLLGRAKDKYKATVRLYSVDGIKVGDTLYVVNNNNLIVAKLLVKNIFKSVSLGYMLVGYGNCRLAGVDYMVTQRVEDEFAKNAYVYKSRGDYYVNIGDYGKAITEYKKSLEMDKGSPETYIALGYVYLNQGVDRFAYHEFQEAYKRMNRLYDNEDKYLLLKGLVDVIYKEVYHTSNLNNAMKKKFISQGVTYCREALNVYKKSFEMNYYMAMFHYQGPETDHRVAKDYFLKVIELKPDHAESYAALSNLFFMHGNKDKARMYLDKALEIDKFNPDARRMLNKMETFNN